MSDIIQSCRKIENVTVKHHYQVDIFTAAIDHQLQVLNNTMNERVMELLTLSNALNPKDGFISFNVGDICTLVERFYPQDFSDQENIHLNSQLKTYELDVPNHPSLKNLSNIADLCRVLVETRKSEIYDLVDRLLRLLLTLPVSSATTGHAFSSIKFFKTNDEFHQSSIEDEFLRDFMVVYIEKEFAKKISVDKIIDDFNSMKEEQQSKT